MNLKPGIGVLISAVNGESCFFHPLKIGEFLFSIFMGRKVVEFIRSGRMFFMPAPTNTGAISRNA
jgi:hypothetical protein